MQTFPLTQAQIKQLLTAKSKVVKEEEVVSKWTKAASEEFYMRLQGVKSNEASK